MGSWQAHDEGRRGLYLPEPAAAQSIPVVHLQRLETSNINATNTGNSAASALLGLPATFTGAESRLRGRLLQYALWAGYVQDSWRCTPKLTVNFGLRYDFLPAIHMLDKRLANGLDIPNADVYDLSLIVAACTSTFANPCIPGGIATVPFNNHIVFANEPATGRAADQDNIGPRLGFAYARPRQRR